MGRVRRVADSVKVWMRTWAAVIAAGLALVAIPTVFTIFSPELTRGAVPLRIGVLVVWIALAINVVFVSARQGRQIEELAGEVRDRREQQSVVAGANLLDAFLSSRGGRASDYEFRVFMFDADLGKLKPVWEPEGVESSEGWEPGKGATGTAWELDEFVLATGDRVWDTTFGLSGEQAERYKSLRIVGSMPVRNARQKTIAILSASSEFDSDYMQTPAGERELIIISQVVARILIDVLGWARD